jgi:hypothetical protein
VQSRPVSRWGSGFLPLTALRVKHLLGPKTAPGKPCFPPTPQGTISASERRLRGGGFSVAQRSSIESLLSLSWLLRCLVRNACVDLDRGKSWKPNAEGEKGSHYSGQGPEESNCRLLHRWMPSSLIAIINGFISRPALPWDSAQAKETDQAPGCASLLGPEAIRSETKSILNPVNRGSLLRPLIA